MQNEGEEGLKTTVFDRHSMEKQEAEVTASEDEPPPYRVENWSDSRALALRFLGA